MMNEAEASLRSALNDFYSSKDVELLTVKANERSITHKLANYIEKYFLEYGYDCDCEYNRNGSLTKRLVSLVTTVKTDDTRGKTVYPDIIVHKRGKPDGNFIVIEAKMKGVSTEDDITKLKAYSTDLEYKHAFMLVLAESGYSLDEMQS